jgi:hypothetical protein
VRRSSLPWLLLWLALGVAVWNGFYQLYIEIGTHQYLQLAAEAELKGQPGPSMSGVMDLSQRAGARAATIWAALIVAAGLGTVYLRRR